MSKIVQNYGGGTTDEYGTFLSIDRLITGNVAQGLNVIANGTPNMTVLVQPGSGFIPTGTSPSNYNYRIAIDTSAGEPVTISTAAASPRIDYIVAYIDKSVSGSTSGSFVNNTNAVLKLAAVAGTPAGSPNPPTTGQISTAIGASNPYIVLAQVAVAASVSSITQPNITDLRVFAVTAAVRAAGVQSNVNTGLFWAATTGLNASMSAGLAFINVATVQVPVSIAAISSRAFTASKDTYVYVDYSSSVFYLEVPNGATPPTLPVNATWLARVVTSGSAVTSVLDLRCMGNSPGPSASYKGYFTTSPGTSSSTWLALNDPTGVPSGSKTIAITTGRVRIDITLPFTISSGNAEIGVYDGANFTEFATSSGSATRTYSNIITGLPVGSIRTFQFAIKSSGGSTIQLVNFIDCNMTMVTV